MLIYILSIYSSKKCVTVAENLLFHKRIRIYSSEFPLHIYSFFLLVR